MATWTCQVDNLMIRKGAGTSSPLAGGKLYKGQKVTEKSTINVNGVMWVEHNGGPSGVAGWSATTAGSSMYLVKDNDVATGVTTSTTNSPAPVVDETSTGYNPGLGSLLEYDVLASDVLAQQYYTIKDSLSVLGLPYQYLPHVDPRIVYTNQVDRRSAIDPQLALGGEYAERIIARMPLLLLTPGKASFMTKFGQKDKKNTLDKFMSVVANVVDKDKTKLDDMLSKEGRYYTFEYDTARYYSYVNPMCRIASVFMGVENQTLDGVAMKNMDWSTYTGNRIRSFADIPMAKNGGYGAIPFYINSDTSITDSFGNSTTESILKSHIDGASDMSRELRFLLGYSSSALMEDALMDTDINADIESVNSMITKLLGKGNFMNNLANHLGTIVTGGKLTFPEIWADSTFSRSYNVSLKFISPDMDKLSIYFNIIVPLMHLLGLVGPQSLTNNPNGYTNPFLVRGIYKGMFNVDMGIITDMTITRGAEGQWTPDGIPTVLDVNFTIKDLYDNISITSMDNIQFDTLNNTALMDYIANACGVNVYKPEIARAIDMWIANNFTNRAKDILNLGFWGKMTDEINNTIINRIWRQQGWS